MPCPNPPCTVTYDNNCFACADENVETFTDGKCEDEDVLGTLCPSDRPVICTQEAIPVCGYFNENVNCLVPPCAATYSNQCIAC